MAPRSRPATPSETEAALAKVRDQLEKDVPEAIRQAATSPQALAGAIPPVVGGTPGNENMDDDEVDPGDAAKMLYVQDLSARTRVRRHMIPNPDGLPSPVDFPPGQRVAMPFERGILLVPLEGFVVTTYDGRQIQSTERRLTPNAMVTLRTDQVVASLNELTTEALVARCKAYTDGQHFNVDSPRAEMFVFLVDMQNEEADRAVADYEQAMINKLRGTGFDMRSPVG